MFVEISSEKMMQDLYNDRRHIIDALSGHLNFTEDEIGFHIDSFSKHASDDFVIKAYDNVVYHLLHTNALIKAIDVVTKKNGFDLSKYDIEIIKEYELGYDRMLEQGDYIFESGLQAGSLGEM